MTAVWYAEIDTPHFTFFACGASRQQALQAVMHAWAAHAAQTGADLDYVESNDVNVQRCVLGQGYRDEVAQPLGETATADGMNTARITRERRKAR
jgi:hypothetical protein